MAELSAPPTPLTGVSVSPTGWLRNLIRYSVRRLSTLAGAVVLAVFLTIVIANLGGYVDEVIRAQIDFAIVGMVQGGWLRDTPEAERPASLSCCALCAG
jgi:peptide/nickel transport system permease protein